MNRIGRSEVDHGRQRTISESLERISAVTGEQVAALARELLAAAAQPRRWWARSTTRTRLPALGARLIWALSGPKPRGYPTAR